MLFPSRILNVYWAVTFELPQFTLKKILLLRTVISIYSAAFTIEVIKMLSTD